ncbi:MAG: hypothetical protein AAGF47_02290 [Planctomycetota bacterium]
MSASPPPEPEQRRKQRHDILNTIGVIKLELRVAKNLCDGKATEAIASVECEVRKLQDQLKHVFDEPDP